VFLWHSSADKAQIRGIRARLVADGFSPWLDEAGPLPGQYREQEIRTAVRRSSAVLVFFITSSLTKEGFVQKRFNLHLTLQMRSPTELTCPRSVST
jgi:TIR domain-containing protein